MVQSGSASASANHDFGLRFESWTCRLAAMGTYVESIPPIKYSCFPRLSRDLAIARTPDRAVAGRIGRTRMCANVPTQSRCSDRLASGEFEDLCRNHETRFHRIEAVMRIVTRWPMLLA